MASAKLPADAVFSVSEVSDPGRREEDMEGDEEWIETYCGEVLARLKHQVPFKRDATIYRRTRDARRNLRATTRDVLGQNKIQDAGPYYRLFTKFVNIDHPRNWMPCGPCGATGMTDHSRCGYCHGEAYTLKTERPR